MIIPSRRRFLFGAGAALLAAPAIVRASSLMAVKPLPPPAPGFMVVEFRGVRGEVIKHVGRGGWRPESYLDADQVVWMGDSITVPSGAHYLVRPAAFTPVRPA